MNRRTPLQRRTPLRQVSRKRARENRQRKADANAEHGPERPLCAWPSDSPHWADAWHEPLTRARGGSITDPANRMPMCNLHNGMLSSLTGPQLVWAYEAGLLIHSWGTT